LTLLPRPMKGIQTVRPLSVILGDPPLLSRLAQAAGMTVFDWKRKLREKNYLATKAA
jgi:hypothetical protein